MAPIPYDISNAKYLGSSFSFSVLAQDTTPTGITFSTDGLKMFMVGFGSDSIHQYNLTTPFDISTASFSGNSFSVSSEDTSPTGLDFSTDGLKMFMVGVSSNSIHQYTLTSPFDISTASFSGNSFSVSSEDTSPTGVDFSTDGLQMFMIGISSRSIHQYNLTTAFDISSASFSGNSFNVTSEDNNPRGMSFSTDGLKMFIVGISSQSIHQYNVITPFDISTASFSGNSFSVAVQDTVPTGMAISNDGLKMFMTGDFSDSVHQYILKIPFEISTATFSINSFSVAVQETAPTGMAFSTDGLKMFMTGDSSDSVHQYNLTTAFDISTASFSGNSFNVQAQDTTPTGITFSTDGLKMFMVGFSSDSIHQYTLTSPFDISSASFSGNSFSVSSEDTSPTGITFSTDGLKMFMIGVGSNSIHQYNLTTLFDITTASFSGNSFSVSSQDTSPTGVVFSTDGLQMFMIGVSSRSIHQYILTTLFDISTASSTGISFNVTSEDNNPRGMAFSNDGLKIFMVGLVTDSIYQYFIFGISTKNFTIDGQIAIVKQKILTVNSLILKIFQKTFQINSFLRIRLTKLFSVNSLLQKTFTKIFSVDSILKKTLQKTFSVDSVIVNIVTKSFTINSILNQGLTKLFTVDSVLALKKQKTFLFNSLTRILRDKTFTINGLLQNPNQKIFGINAVLKALNTQKQFFLNSVLGTINSKTFTLNGFLVNLETKGFQIDSLIQDTLTKIFSANSILVNLREKTFLSDSVLKGLKNKTFTINSILKIPLENSFSVDSILFKTLSKIFSADSQIANRLIKTFSANSLLAAIKQKIFSFDSFIVSVITKLITIDSLLMGDRTKQFSIDSSLQVLREKIFSLNSLLRLEVIKLFFINSIVKLRSQKNFTMDSIILPQPSRVTKTVRAELCFEDNVKSDLCIQDTTKSDLCV